PALLGGVEMLGEIALQYIALLRLIEMGGHFELELLAERHGGLEPGLAELVVTLALEAIVELLPMLLQGVRQAKPLDRQQKHPIDRPLHRLVSLLRLIQLEHPLLTMAQMKGLLF